MTTQLTTRLQTRTQVLIMDEAGHDTAKIAAALGIPEQRVEWILDQDMPDHDFAFLDREPPALRSEAARAKPLNVNGSPGRPATPREHGTLRGVNQHKYRKETWCADCRAAYSASQRKAAQ